MFPLTYILYIYITYTFVYVVQKDMVLACMWFAYLCFHMRFLQFSNNNIHEIREWDIAKDVYDRFQLDCSVDVPDWSSDLFIDSAGWPFVLAAHAYPEGDRAQVSIYQHKDMQNNRSKRPHAHTIILNIENSHSLQTCQSVGSQRFAMPLTSRRRRNCVAWHLCQFYVCNCCCFRS